MITFLTGLILGGAIGLLIAALFAAGREEDRPEIIQCKDCKYNPKIAWFECPMAGLSERQRPETGWCHRAQRREE